MNVFKIIEALILMPFAALLVFIIAAVTMAILAEYGEDILGIGFLLGWLALIFSVIYKLLS